MRRPLTTYEAANKYDLSTGYLRQLLIAGTINGWQGQINPAKVIWLIDEASLKKYLTHRRKPGPRPGK